MKRKKMDAEGHSREHLKATGWISGSTSRWNEKIKRMVDLFGLIDRVAIHPLATDTWGIQATSLSNVQARMAKLIEIPNAIVWLSSPHRKLWIHGWVKIEHRLVVEITEIFLQDVPQIGTRSLTYGPRFYSLKGHASFAGPVGRLTVPGIREHLMKLKG